jgi:type IV secretory pathway VirB10-like protein
MKSPRPVLFLTFILLIVGLACSALSGGGSAPTQPPATAAPVQPVNNPPPAEPPQPTEAPPTEAPAATATEAPVVSQAQDYFTEEFNTPLSSDWTSFTVTGSTKADPSKVTVEAKDGNLVWNFDSEYVYYYLFYQAYKYDDVKLDVRADNRGRNNNSISLICRYDPDVGWYEFNIANNGLYNILFADSHNSSKIAYKNITNGGSNAIKQGKGINEYSISCKGDKLSLTINGEEVTTVPERNYGLTDGMVGVSVSSFNVLPILINMDWIKISQP